MYENEDGKTDKEPVVINSDKEPVAKKILENMAQIAEFASNLSDRVDMKLSPIIYQMTEGSQPDDVKQVEYPALFNEMRVMLDSITSSLTSIDKSISRVEL